MAPKYFLALILALVCSGALIVFRRHFVTFSFFALIVASGIGACYRLRSQNDSFYDYLHMGGALAEPVVYLIDFPIILVVGAAFLEVIVRKKAFPAWTLLDTLILIFLVSMSISFFNVKDFSFAFFEIVRYVKYVMLYMSLRVLFDEKILLRWLVIASTCILGLQGIVSIAQYFFGFSLPFSVIGGEGGVTTDTVIDSLNIFRVTGMIGACNTFATWLLFPITVCSASLFLNIKARNKTIILSSLVLGLVALILTFSRTGISACIVCFVTLMCIMAAKKRLTLNNIAALVFTILVSAAAVWILGVGPYLTARFESGFDGAYEARPELNKIGMMMLKDHPFIGVGLNNFQTVSSHYDPTRLTAQFDNVPHNIYMLFASETGIFGMLSFICMGIFLFRRAFLLAKHSSDDLGFCIGVGCTTYLIGIMVNGMFDGTLRIEPVVAQCTIMAALIMSVKSVSLHIKTPETVG